MLANRVITQSKRTMWVEYREGFFLCFRYCARAELDKMWKQSTRRIFDTAKNETVDQVDNDQFLRKLATLIVDWEGLTADVLKGMVELDEYRDEPYSQEAAFTLLKHAYHFDRWVQAQVMDLQAFSTWEEEKERKKSQPSSSAPSGEGSPDPVISA